MCPDLYVDSGTINILLTSLLTCLGIGPYCLQAEGPKRQPNPRRSFLCLFCVIIYLLWMYVSFIIIIIIIIIIYKILHKVLIWHKP